MLKEWLYKIKWQRYHPTAFARYREILENERKSADELAAMREKLRQNIVRVAFENTAFYHHHYAEAGFALGEMGKAGWFERLPILTKAHIRAHFEEITDQKQRAFRGTDTTGGSTGEPVRIGADRRLPNEVYSWRLQRWFGVNPWDDHAYIWRQQRTTRKAQLKNALQWWPTRHLKLDATMTKDDMRRFLKEYNRVRPALLQGYVGSVAEFAQFVIDNKQKAHRPKFVWTTSAPLTEVDRRIITEAFHAPVCDQYGSHEVGWFAQQCPACGGLHVNVEHVDIEYVDEANRPVPTGDYGKALVTNFEDTVFPLIRYENGDAGRWLIEPCSCGCTLPLIDTVKGRMAENFVLPSGKTLAAVTSIFSGNPDVAKGFRVIQHKDLSITVEYIPSEDTPENDAAFRVEMAKFEKRVNGEVPIEYRKVKEIRHDRGKQRFVIREK